MSKVKNTKKSLYILTEGHTEYAYFSRIKEIMGDEDDWKYSVTVDVREIVNGSKTDPLNMVKEAISNLSDFNEVWVVFDKDRQRDKENGKAFDLAKKRNIKVAFSSISFEQWILLHFERSIKSFERSNCESRKKPCTCNGERCILTYIKQNYYPNYVKGRARLYDELVDKQNVALEYAAWLKWRNEVSLDFILRNPYTDVDTLVAYLLELPIIKFVDLNTPFKFNDFEFRISDIIFEMRRVEVTIMVTNNSNSHCLFNNFQKNIILIGKSELEVNYSLPHTEICYPGEQKEVVIEFEVDDKFVASRLKFSTINEIFYIEF